MKFEVYVKHIFQEYPVTEKIDSITSDGWRKYERNCGCRGNVAMPPIDARKPNLFRVFLRSEEFGGLLYDPTSAIIYKLDKEAFNLIQHIVNKEDIYRKKSEDKMIRELSKKVKRDSVKKLISKLKEVDLWWKSEHPS